METLFSEYGEFLGNIPEECVTACTHSGECLTDVEYWVKELNFNVPLVKAKEYLKEFGAWEDLDTCNQKDLNNRCLWIACNDIMETGEWLGLIH